MPTPDLLKAIPLSYIHIILSVLRLHRTPAENHVSVIPNKEVSPISHLAACHPCITTRVAKSYYLLLATVSDKSPFWIEMNLLLSSTAISRINSDSGVLFDRYGVP